jgi:hypothetical protein
MNAEPRHAVRRAFPRAIPRLDRSPPMQHASTPSRRVFRLLHSTGDILITDRSEALARLHHLPGAKLFILAV